MPTVAGILFFHDAPPFRIDLLNSVRFSVKIYANSSLYIDKPIQIGYNKDGAKYRSDLRYYGLMNTLAPKTLILAYNETVTKGEEKCLMR